jgi:hypothetical protein
MTESHSHPLPQAYRSYIERELLRGLAFNLVLSLAFTMLLFPEGLAIAMFGKDGIAADLVPTAFMLTLMGGLAMTLMTRKRVRDGVIVPMPAEFSGRIERNLPRNVLVRNLTVALGVTLVTVPMSVLMLWILGVESMSYHAYLGFKAVYGPLVGALSTAVVIKAALQDPIR